MSPTASESATRRDGGRSRRILSRLLREIRRRFSYDLEIKLGTGRLPAQPRILGLHLRQRRTRNACASNVISRILEHVPYEAVPAPKGKLPKRKVGRYKAVDLPFKYVPELF